MHDLYIAEICRPSAIFLPPMGCVYLHSDTASPGKSYV